jgi:fluoride exporter
MNRTWAEGVLVFVGGGLGSVCRYGLSRWITAAVETRFPLGTLGVNALGCFAIGLWLTWAQRWASSLPGTVVPGTASPWTAAPWTLLWATGFCGGFTTFSTFAYENRRLLAQQSLTLSIAYTFTSLAIGLGAVCLGEWVARRF